MTTEQMNDYFEELEAVCLKNDNIAPRLFEEWLKRQRSGAGYENSQLCFGCTTE